jgi:hypothetical protein
VIGPIPGFRAVFLQSSCAVALRRCSSLASSVWQNDASSSPLVCISVGIARLKAYANMEIVGPQSPSRPRIVSFLRE